MDRTPESWRRGGGLRRWAPVEPPVLAGGHAQLDRHRLHREPGVHGFAMVWVAVPALTVERSEQGYEHLRRTEGDGGAVVRFSSDGGSFVADLVVDADGLLVDYPELARRRTS